MDGKFVTRTQFDFKKRSTSSFRANLMFVVPQLFSQLFFALYFARAKSFSFLRNQTGRRKRRNDEGK